MNSITLLGPTYLDRIFTTSGQLELDASNDGMWSHRLGGVFNVARRLEGYSDLDVEVTVSEIVQVHSCLLTEPPHLKLVWVERDYFVEATVVLDPVTAVRTALLPLGATPVAIRTRPQFSYANILHIAYLDAIEFNPEILKRLRGEFRVLVADLCSTVTSSSTLDYLQQVDILLCSASEFSALEKGLSTCASTHNLPPFTVVHDPSFLLMVENGISTRIEQLPFTNVSTLGAGDIFAADFLYFVTTGVSYAQAAIMANDEARRHMWSRRGTK